MVVTGGALVIVDAQSGERKEVEVTTTSPVLRLTADGVYALVVGGALNVIRIADRAKVAVRFYGSAFRTLESEIAGFPE